MVSAAWRSPTRECASKTTVTATPLWAAYSDSAWINSRRASSRPRSDSARLSRGHAWMTLYPSTISTCMRCSVRHRLTSGSARRKTPLPLHLVQQRGRRCSCIQRGHVAEHRQGDERVAVALGERPHAFSLRAHHQGNRLRVVEMVVSLGSRRVEPDSPETGSADDLQRLCQFTRGCDGDVLDGARRRLGRSGGDRDSAV